MNPLCPVEFGGNCPQHIVITHWNFSTACPSHYFERDSNIAEVEKRKAASKARAEAKRLERESTRDLDLEARKQRAVLQAEYRRVASENAHKAYLERVDAEKQRKRDAYLAAIARRKEATRRRKLDELAQEREQRRIAKAALAPPGWVPLRVAAAMVGVSEATTSKYSTCGYIETVRIGKANYTDPVALRIIYDARQIEWAARLKLGAPGPHKQKPKERSGECQ